MAAWAGVHGVATLASRRVLALLEVDPDELLARVVPRGA